MISLVQRQGSLYSDSERYSAVEAYLSLGNIRRVSALTGVPSRTLYDWQKTQWWDDLSAQLRAERDAELDSALTKVIESGVSSVLDRLECGDLVVKRDGSFVRKPISTHEIVSILKVVYDMRQQLREVSYNNHRPTPLSEIAEKLEEIGNARRHMDVAGK